MLYLVLQADLVEIEHYIWSSWKCGDSLLYMMNARDSRFMATSLVCWRLLWQQQSESVWVLHLVLPEILEQLPKHAKQQALQTIC